MKLIEYIVGNDKEIEAFKMAAGIHEMSIEDYIMTGYCPSRFTSVNDTLYEKPYAPSKKKDICKYHVNENQNKCNECWNRQVLVVSK